MILAFVGIKMIILEWYHIPTAISLAVIIVVLFLAVVLSIKADRAKSAQPPMH